MNIFKTFMYFGMCVLIILFLIFWLTMVTRTWYMYMNYPRHAAMIEELAKRVSIVQKKQNKDKMIWTVYHPDDKFLPEEKRRIMFRGDLRLNIESEEVEIQGFEIRYSMSSKEGKTFVEGWIYPWNGIPIIIGEKTGEED